MVAPVLRVQIEARGGEEDAVSTEAAMSLAAGTEEVECEACAAMREMLRLCLGALSEYYKEPAAGRRAPASLSELIRGGALLRAERALRAGCTCGQQPFDLRAKCRELGCRPRSLAPRDTAPFGVRVRSFASEER